LAVKKLLVIAVAMLAASVFAEQVLTAELLPPTKAVVLKAQQVETLKAVARADKARKALQKSWGKEKPTKTDFKELRRLETTVEHGRTAKQGVNLTLKLTNTSDKVITFNYGADTSTNSIALSGPGAVNLAFNGPMTLDYRQGKKTTLAPGESAGFVISELRYGKRDSSRWLITEPGTYTVNVTFTTHVKRKKIAASTGKVTFEVVTQ
jgi:surface-anchored protein